MLVILLAGAAFASPYLNEYYGFETFSEAILSYLHLTFIWPRNESTELQESKTVIRRIVNPKYCSFTIESLSWSLNPTRPASIVYTLISWFFLVGFMTIFTTFRCQSVKVVRECSKSRMKKSRNIQFLFTLIVLAAAIVMCLFVRRAKNKKLSEPISKEAVVRKIATSIFE